MPNPGDAAIQPRSDLTLHHAPPPAPTCPQTPTCIPHKEKSQSWVSAGGWSKALHDATRRARACKPTMSQRQCTAPKFRETWHGWSPDKRFGSNGSTGKRMESSGESTTRFSFARYQTSNYRSPRQHDFRFSSTRSHDDRNYYASSRGSPLHSSVQSRSSLYSVKPRASSIRSSLRRARPLYREASARAKTVKEWAGTLGQRVTVRAETPLLTPAHGRRQPVEVATCGSSSPVLARNSPRFHATRRAASAARTVHWEVASGLAALFECGATAGSAAAVGVERACTAAAAMADGKLQQLRRSISSWSLSTVKKPKITLPKLKAPKIKIIRGGRKNRVEPKDEATTLEEVKAALLKAEDPGASKSGVACQSGETEKSETDSEVIHEPSAGGPQEGQPTIVLTVHEHKNPPEPPSPPPSPGLLSVKDGLEYIDSDEGEHAGIEVTEVTEVIEAVHPELVEYSDQWSDASGTLTRSKENITEAFNYFDDGQESRYYDFVDYTVENQKEEEEKTDKEESRTTLRSKPKGGSQKARDWVKNFDEKAETRIQKWMKMKKPKSSTKLPKSKSEINLDNLNDPPDKWTKRDEIKLNTLGRDDQQAELLNNPVVKVKEKEQKKEESEKEKSTRKETLKKIFQVRGKMSVKPIVESNMTTCNDSDIHIAAAPSAAATAAAEAASENNEPLEGEDSQKEAKETTDSFQSTPSETFTHLQNKPSDLPSQSAPIGNKGGSEITKKIETSKVSAGTKGFQDVKDEQIIKKITVKEVRQAEKKPVPQPQDVSKDISITPAINNISETQESYKKEDNDKKLAPLAQAKDFSLVNGDKISQNTSSKLSNCTNNNKEEIDSIVTEDSNDKDKDKQVKSVLQTSETGSLTNFTSFPTHETTEIIQSHTGMKLPSIGIAEQKKEEVTTESVIGENNATRKNKILGSNFPKSIKTFAGSVFSNQTGLKGKGEVKEEESPDKKKKKGKMSQFTRDNLFRVPFKEKNPTVKERGQTPSTVKDKCINNKADDEKTPNSNPFEDDEDNPLPEEVSNISESKEASKGSKEVEAFFCEPSNSKSIHESPHIPSSFEIPQMDKSPSTSAVSLEFVSQIDSDEVKSDTHESSPGMDSSFVEEDGLRLRKDALLVIKAMEAEETTTNYYSFLSASEEFQTPMLENKEIQTTHSNILIKESVSQSATKQQPDVILSHEVHCEREQAEENMMKQGLGHVTETPVVVNSNGSNAQNISNDVEEENLKNNTTSTELKLENEVIESPRTCLKDTEEQGTRNCNLKPQPQEMTPPTKEVSPYKEDISPYNESQEPPKPSPRTKKGRYGYSSVAGCAIQLVTPRGTTPSTGELPVRGYSVNGESESTVRSSDSNVQATCPGKSLISRKELQRVPSDTGYSGPGINCTGSSDAEPIYWEISDQQISAPRPSPRIKKGQKALYVTRLNQGKEDSHTSPNITVKEESQTKPIPEWINTRAPIPSPRGKKQRSLQSLPSVVPAEDTMESVKIKLQIPSNEPLPDVTLKQQMPIMTKKEEEQFYSGKAASISYGFTPSQVPPPSLPMRIRKASQVSLPAAMAAEEAQTKQQKRRSLYVTADGEAVPEPPSPKTTRRRMNLTTQQSKLRKIEAAVKAEELLSDVLYAVHSLMGGASAGVWKVGGDGAPGGPSSRAEVQMEQVLGTLQAAFQVTEDTMERLRDDARGRPPPEVSLQLCVKEAKELRPKTVKGTTNPYVIVSVPSNNTSHRTRLEKDTLRPKWNQQFTLPISNFQKEFLRFEVWHEHDPVQVRQALTAVRDIKGMSRLVKGTTAHVQQQTSHLLGHVVVNVKDLSERGTDGWFTLEKNEERSKERGSIHLAGTVTSKAQLENKNRLSYDALLARLVHHQLKAITNNNEQNEWSRPWTGALTGPGAAALAQYAIMLDLSDAAIQLAWWKVGSRIATADGEWVLSRLRDVQTAMSKHQYKDNEILELRSSFSSFVRDNLERIKDLHKAFPPPSGVIARRQLSFTLKALQCMQHDPGTRALLDLEGFPHLHDAVTSSLATHAKNWWTTVIDELRGVRTTDEQISRVINILQECYTFLSIASNSYNGIFVKEMSIPYMQTTYLMVSKKVNPCVRPLVMNIYNRMPALNDQPDDEFEDCEFRLEVGTSLWELYMNLGRLHQLGDSLPEEAQEESGVREYHRWFSRGVLRWLELALCRARSMIKKAVELDMLNPQDAYCKFSSSASDTLGIFNDIKIWWQKLAWPDPENSVVVLTKILEDICSCVLSYSNLIREKVERIFHAQENITRAFITEQICVGLNNIERVRTEMVKLPTQFGFQELLQKIRAAGTGDGAAAQLEATVDRLIVNAAENMETKVTEFIDTVLEKMHPTLERAVNEACEAQSSNPLLAQVLDPSLELTIDRLNASNFNRFLWRVWEVVLEIFTATVMRNSERRKANYFGGVHSILEATLKFFSPPDGKGLDEKTAMTPAYTSLIELLESLRMSSESLIAQYYQERHEEQREEILPCKARLYARILFTKPGKLIVEVIMAKDMVVESDTTSITSRGGGIGTAAHQPVDSYVKVQLVPQEWFPTAPIRKTKTQRKQDPAVYEETFEYDLSKTDDGVRAGFLLLTLKDYNLGFSNTFIGEAVVPLSTLPCVDSSQVHTVSNTCLTMTSPGLDIGYKSLRALHFRTGDKVASAFVKKVSKRLIEPKTKAGTPLRPDDDKARSKSPNLRERLKFS